MTGCFPTATSETLATAKDRGAVALGALDACAAECSAAARLCVGYSGGRDSTVLLHALNQRYPGRVLALHLNHGLHSQAASAEQHCREFCREQGIELLSSRPGSALSSDGQGVEAAARAARYAWFERILQVDDLLLLAHHQDDQAETLLLRLLRGAGPDGLAAMPARRAVGRATLLRPYLALPAATLAAYADAHALSWFDDPSNESQALDRNYLRHRVMPLLAARWPGYRKTFGRAAGQLRAQREARHANAGALSFNIVGDPGLPVAALQQDPPQAADLLRAWLAARRLLMPPAAQLREFLRQLREGQGAQLVTSAWTLQRYRDEVFCFPARLPAAPPPQAIAMGQSLRWGGLGQVLVSGDPAQLQLSGGENARLVLRARHSGDRLLFPDGQHRELKQVYQSLGIPPWWRARLPLLVRPGDDSSIADGRGYGESPPASAGTGNGRQERVDEVLAVGPFFSVWPGLSLRWVAPVIPANAAVQPSA